MNNRIACSAHELNQLDPAMLQSVVGGTIFEIGNQYFTDQRVNIVDADKSQVTAEVHGAYGMYSQTIKLRAGTLSTRCSCPLTEQPFCRHCVAVLLHQIHNGSSLKSAAKAAHQDSMFPGSELQVKSADRGFESSNGAGELNFWEAILFIDWVQKAAGLLGKEAGLPPVPDSLSGVAREWVGAVKQVHAQCLQSEEERSQAQKKLETAEGMIDSLRKKLEVLKGETKTAHQSADD